MLITRRVILPHDLWFCSNRQLKDRIPFSFQVFTSCNSHWDSKELGEEIFMGLLEPHMHVLYAESALILPGS